MRDMFFKELKTEMSRDANLFFLFADMGLGLVEPFQREFPDRVMNVGIAEQNLVGIAAGLCNAGFRPVCYTISNFLVERSFEQIRNDVCLHNYPVTLVGTSTGYDNGILGSTHHVLDDIGCMKTLPGMNIYSPACVTSIKRVFREVMDARMPAYIRIGTGSLKWDHAGDSMNYMAVDGPTDAPLIVTHGNIFENCVKAAGDGLFSVYCVNKVHPLDPQEWGRIFKDFPRIYVAEDHFRGSGLYNSLCQLLAETPSVRVKLVPISPRNAYSSCIGDKNYFSDLYGLSAEKIAQTVLG